MSLAGALSAALPGTELIRAVPLTGGDLSEVFRVELSDGRIVAAKRGKLAAREARMLRAMAASGARVPAVMGLDGDLMVLEWLEPATADDAAWRACGAGLRLLHGCRASDYGWDEDYAFGRVPIPNGRMQDWPSFWAERRLLPCLPDLPAPLARRVETLAARLPELLPAHPPAALLHGDFWTGNVHFTGGTGALIDPACCHGDAEADLAMLALFGRIPDAFLDGYGPLEAGWDSRRPLYQLWPALVHLRLFGGGYRGLVEGLLERAGH